MSPAPPSDTVPAWDRDAVAARAARVGERAEAELGGAIADFFLSNETRLDDRTRAALAATMRGVVAGVEADIRRHAARLLADEEQSEKAEAVLTRSSDVFGRLMRAGVLKDADLMGEMIARVRLDLIEAALPVAVSGPDAPSLLVRLANAPDRVVAVAAAALLAADNRRRDANESGAGIDGDLPVELHRRLVWWIAAAIRGDADADVDRAIVASAERSLSAHDETDRVEAIASRLAAAIAPRRSELPDLLVETLGNRRLQLFVALLAQALDWPTDQARTVTLEPAGDRLWLACRAIDLDRATIAKIALALADADPTRDIEAFADDLDAIAAVAVGDARAALASLTLHRDYRDAIRALKGQGG
ncbi:DUF2336 domain-containing protein [Microvirga sp. SRT01]|uniref:DUF2336 domain-containing protein n=1 Tax=Sphingomonas longa TaxID=2778730 RepID=A0ABS2D2R9_9SPHN|nr:MULTISPECIES: DUF2336 domain-containing protein [Alphaproteobacteria]MBM6575205.1 DUF2336 domain-containing protein [Sphingomonas sp. BT552]MBR7708255.1 DUF2336 domain-containing protein [Microvirga sp. SRT01]